MNAGAYSKYVDDYDDEPRLVISDDVSSSSSSCSPGVEAQNDLSECDEKIVETDEQNVLPGGDTKNIVSESEKTREEIPQLPQTSQAKENSNAFCWPAYLKETGGYAAPDSCFYQDPAPPENKFKVGMKIQAPDPRGTMEENYCRHLISRQHHPGKNGFEVGMKFEAVDRKNFNSRLCPATIIDVKGDFITIGYDGWSEAYDSKERYDSRQIFPIGWAAKCGLEIQPPRRIKAYLKETGGYAAPDSCFYQDPAPPENKFKVGMKIQAPDPRGTMEENYCRHLISRQHHPGKNGFEVGMKFEAVDRKNFNSRLCPATIIDVKGDFITIGYDGWSEAYDSKERYDSRQIFPIGWAAKCGLEIQPPRRIKVKSKKSRKSNSLSRSAHKAQAQSRKRKRTSSHHRRGTIKIHRKNHLLEVIDEEKFLKGR
ncbi:unnamed protein product [Gongylonema pulchrum]|uniref:Mbt repeat family protein n=1 Tax=Gongylonema pulchrum TaxID=637853 RepID=A0A183DX99_9BILA|nr:unnamed protein product [Gongylonema pulchrum]